MCYRPSARRVLEENSIVGARSIAGLLSGKKLRVRRVLVFTASIPRRSHRIESRESRGTTAPSETRDYVNSTWIMDDRDLIPSLSFGHATSAAV